MTNYSEWWFSLSLKWLTVLIAFIALSLLLRVCLHFLQHLRYCVNICVPFLYLISAAEPLTCILSLNPSSLWFSSIMQSALATHLFSLHSTKTWQLSHSQVRELLASISLMKNIYFIFWLWLLEQYKYEPDHIQHNIYIHRDFQLKAYITKSEWGETEEEGKEEIHLPSIFRV